MVNFIQCLKALQTISSHNTVMNQKTNHLATITFTLLTQMTHITKQIGKQVLIHTGPVTNVVVEGP